MLREVKDNRIVIVMTRQQAAAMLHSLQGWTLYPTVREKLEDILDKSIKEGVK
jgi:hypothetical protein